MEEKVAEPTVAATTAVNVGDAEEALQHVKNIKKQHQWDPNLPTDVYDEIDEAMHARIVAELKERGELAHDV